MLLVEEHVYFELATFLTKVANGTKCSLQEVYQNMQKVFANFQESAKMHNWRFISMYLNAKILEYVAIENLRGSTFVELGIRMD